MPALTLVVIGWLAGIVTASLLGQPFASWLALAGGGLALLSVWRGRVRWRLPLLGLIALALGAARYQLAQPTFDATALAYYNDTGSVTVEGIVWDEPEVRDADAEARARTNLRVRVETLTLSDGTAPLPVSGLVLVYAPRFSDSRLTENGQAEWRYGDRVTVTGNLETPPEFADFSYRDYLARSGIHSQIRNAQVQFLAERQGQPLFQLIFDFKARALATLAQLFPEPHGALLSGILLGVESGIPAEVKDAFRITGTSHVVAISGFNVSILVAVFMALFSRWLGPNRGAALTMIVIAAYTLLVGASASVVRAAIMGGLGLIALRLGRRAVGLNTLAVAALLMTAWNPLTLWDVGFQLSAAATLGLILYAEPLQAALRRALETRLPPEQAERATRLSADTFLLTFAAQITTLPLIAYTFGQLSLISLLANAFILPAQPAVMVLGLVALVLGLLWPPLGQLAAWLTYPFTAYTLAIVRLFARAPGASVPVEVAPAVIVIVYGMLMGVTWMMQRPPEQRPALWVRFVAEGVPLGGAAVLGLAAFFAWVNFFSLPVPGRLRVTALDSGAVAVTTPSGAQVLIDGGPSGGALLRGLAAEWPPYAHDLALLIVTAPRDSRAGGLPDVVNRYRVARAAITESEGRSAALRTARDALAQQSVPIVPLAAGTRFDLGDGAQVQVLAEGLLRVEQGAFSFVLLTAEVEATTLPPATVVLVAPGVGVDEATVAGLDPRVAILAEAAEVEAFAGRTVLRADQRGAVTVSSDGQRMWVETTR
jgi:competence protein ComEC